MLSVLAAMKADKWLHETFGFNSSKTGGSLSKGQPLKIKAECRWGWDKQQTGGAFGCHGTLTGEAFKTVHTENEKLGVDRHRMSRWRQGVPHWHSCDQDGQQGWPAQRGAAGK